MRRTASILALGAALLLMQGCSSMPRQEVHPEHLWVLAGFHEGDSVTLSTVQGETVRFTSETPLELEVVGGPDLSARFVRIEIDREEVLSGTTPTGRRHRVRLADVARAAVRAVTEEERFRRELQEKLGRTVGPQEEGWTTAAFYGLATLGAIGVVLFFVVVS